MVLLSRFIVSLKLFGLSSFPPGGRTFITHPVVYIQLNRLCPHFIPSASLSLLIISTLWRATNTNSFLLLLSLQNAPCTIDSVVNFAFLIINTLPFHVIELSTVEIAFD